MILNHMTVRKLMAEMELYGKRKKAKYKPYKGEIEKAALISQTGTLSQLYQTRNGRLT